MKTIQIEWTNMKTDLSCDESVNKSDEMISDNTPCTFNRFVVTLGFVTLFALSTSGQSQSLHSCETCFEQIESTDSYELALDENRKERIQTEKIMWQNEIQELAKLQNNWDGYGAMPVLPECLKNAITILWRENLSSKYLTDVFANPNGTISLEWNNSENTIGLEVGFRTMSYYMVIDGDKSFFDGLKINDSNLNKLARNVGYV